jgi:hypothetical protein
MKVTLNSAETRMVKGRTRKNGHSLLYSEMNQIPSHRLDSLPVLFGRFRVQVLVRRLAILNDRFCRFHQENARIHLRLDHDSFHIIPSILPFDAV